MTNLPRLELTEDPNKKNDFIIFRHQIGSKKMATFYKNGKNTSKKHKTNIKNKTKRHKKSNSIFKIF